MIGSGYNGALYMAARAVLLERQAYEHFLEKGEEWTRGYLEGRKGKFSNLFSQRYAGAKRALEDMTKTKD